MKCGRVIPPRGARLSFAAGLLEEHANGRRARAEGRSDSRSEPVPCRSAKHQHPLGTISDLTFALYVGYLAPHVLKAPRWMGRRTQKTAHLGLNHHRPISIKKSAKSSMQGASRSTLGIGIGEYSGKAYYPVLDAPRTAGAPTIKATLQMNSRRNRCKLKPLFSPPPPFWPGGP